MRALDPLRDRLLLLPFLVHAPVVVRGGEAHLDLAVARDGADAELVAAAVHEAPRVPPARGAREERDGRGGHRPRDEERRAGRGGTLHVK